MRLIFIIFTIFSYINASINVAVAANARYALNDIIKNFEKIYHIKAKMITASSGKLTAQIINHAPYDIFLSADMKYPNFLYKKGFAISKPKVYAKGKLVLWSLKDIDIKNWKKDILNYKKIAVANPKNAPYGRAAVEVLKRLNIYDKIKNRLIYAQSISQTNQYILSKVVDAGFSAKSVVLSPKMKNEKNWIEIDKNLYNDINQGVVITKYGYKNHKKEVEKFYNFLFSKDAKDILKKYGYE